MFGRKFYKFSAFFFKNADQFIHLFLTKLRDGINNTFFSSRRREIDPAKRFKISHRLNLACGQELNGCSKVAIRAPKHSLDPLLAVRLNHPIPKSSPMPARGACGAAGGVAGVAGVQVSSLLRLTTG